MHGSYSGPLRWTRNRLILGQCSISRTSYLISSFRKTVVLCYIKNSSSASFASPWTGRGRGHFESIFLVPSSLWPASDRGWTLSLKILLFLEAADPEKEVDKQDGGWWVGRFLRNLLSKDSLGSELTTVNPVSTLVSASSFSKLFSQPRPFILAPGSRWREDSCGWESVTGLLGWAEPPGLFHEVSPELSDTGRPPGSGRSTEPTLNLLPRLLRLLSSRVLIAETGVSLELWGRVSAPKVLFRKGGSPFLTSSPGFNWTYGTRRRVNVFR